MTKIEQGPVAGDGADHDAETDAAVDLAFSLLTTPPGDDAVAAHPLLRRPVSPHSRRVHRSGRSPRLRLLLVSDIRTIDSSFAEGVADGLLQRTGRGVLLDRATPTAAPRHGGLPARERLSTYDVVVTVFARDETPAAAALVRRSAARAGVLVVDATARVLRADDESAGNLAALVVDAVVPSIRPRAAERRATLHVDRDARQRAVDRLPFDRIASDTRLRELVQLARLCYGTSHAELNIIDDDLQRTLVASGEFAAIRTLDDSICVRTLELAEPLVLAGPGHFPHPLPGSDEILAFYAGVQLESDEGHRLGTVCVYDSIEPDTNETNLFALTMVAARIEERLIELATPGRRRRPGSSIT